MLKPPKKPKTPAEFGKFILLWLLIILLSIILYVPWRTADLFGVKKKRYLYISMVAATTIAFLLMIPINSTTNYIYYLIYRAFSIWFGALVFLACFLVMFEAVNLLVILLKNERIPKRFRMPGRAHIPKKAAGVIIVALTVMVSTYGVLNTYQIDVVEIDLEFEGFNDTVEIAVLADLHLGSGGGKWALERRVERTNALDPDIVLIPGDIADSDACVNEDIFSPLKDLNAPVYFTTGNHEKYGDPEILAEVLGQCGVRILDNEVIETHGIQLVGLRWMMPDGETGKSDEHNPDGATVESALAAMNLSADKPAILMHHRPRGAQYAQEAGVDLFVAGHNHGGGQMQPFILFCEIFGPEYLRGTHQYKDMIIHVSDGANIYFNPMRVGSDTEITLITVRGK